MQRCKKCGANIPDGRLTCPACGADINARAKTVVPKKAQPAKQPDPPSENPMLKYFDHMNDETLYNFGINSLNGIGVEKDPDAAFKAFSVLANRGYPDGMYKLAQMLASLDPPEMDMAIMWLNRAAEKRHEPSMIMLKNMASMGVISSGGYRVASGGAEAVISSAADEADGASIYERNIRGVMELSHRGGRASGYLISHDGYALTNTHAVTEDNGAVISPIYVNILGKKVTASVVALGDNHHGGGNGVDLALLKLSSVPEGCVPLAFADYDKVRTGDTVYIIGNSLGYGTCITRGIISDKERMLGSQTFMMYDCPTNGGNSGGPVLNCDGLVIATHARGQLSNNGAKVQGMNYGIPEPDVLNFLQRCKCGVEIVKVSVKAPSGESIKI